MIDEDVNNWKNILERLKYTFNNNQFKFFKRSDEFLLNNQDIQINKGGMGLGKTLAICNVIKNNLNHFEHFFIATPTSILKNEWSNELNKLKMEYAIWIAKKDICLKHLNDYKFKLKDCNDDCEYRFHLESNKEYTQTCEHLADSLKHPLNIDEYYENNLERDCLLPITRCSIKRNKIVVGDYFGFLFPKMHRFITEKDMGESCLVIDESHLIPPRVSSLLSFSLNILQTIKGLKEEINTDYFISHRIEEYSKIVESLKIVEDIRERLIQRANQYGEGRYTLKEFEDDWEKAKINYPNAFKILELRDILFLFAQDKLKINPETENNPDHYCIRFIKFIDNWYEKYYNENYSQQFQYFSNKNKEVQLKVICKNPAEYLSNIWFKWKKIIMISGTIPDYNYFSTMLGLNNFKVINEELLSSYSIKKNVVVYPIGDFRNQSRKKTYEDNKELLIKSLKELSGRTLIYVQSKEYSLYLQEQLSPYFKIYNFSKAENGFDINTKELKILQDEFNKEKNAIAILHITGKVEGQNFLDNSGKEVSNIIIYGFPYPRINFEFQDKIEYYTKKLNSKKLAQQYVSFYPSNTTVYQACMRAKRSEKHNPIIILWGRSFSKGHPGHTYSYDELKGELCYSESDFLKGIKKRENERTNI